MASLTGQLVAETYKALLKLIDNDILTASEKQITDGFGGGSNVFIDSQGFLRANKYKVTNGLATQFLKADGSLDSNAYLTSITGAQVITALGYTPVPTTRTITINGETHNLAADNSWTVGGTAAIWGNITGTLSNQTDLQNALNAKYNNPTGTISQYIRGDGTLATFPTMPGGLPTGGTAGQILAKIDATDYNTQWIDNYATQTKNDVKLGQTLTKGTPVYVSSANGTNIIVSRASNTSEALSSKTFGLLESGGATNDIVKCVTFGLIAGLDTSTAQAGDPVWLGVNGALIFGLANKPYAPAHLVYIGVVTRVQQNNGEIFVNIQNGFELKEIHDVYIADPANNHGLFYDIADGLWKNKSIATALGYTPQAQLSGTGFVKASGTTITYDNSTYLTTADAANTYQLLTNLSTDLTASATKYPSVNAVIAGLGTKLNLTGGTLTGNLTISSANPKLLLTDSDNNPDYSIQNADGTFKITNETNSADRFLIYSTGIGYYNGDFKANKLFVDGGLSTQFIKADGTLDSNTYLTAASLDGYLAKSGGTMTGDLNFYTLKTTRVGGNAYIRGSWQGTYWGIGAAATGHTIIIDQVDFSTGAYESITDVNLMLGTRTVVHSGNVATYALPISGGTVTGSITATSFVKSGGTSSQFLMADGSVTTLSSPVTGSGSAGYVPKWTTAANIGSSNIYDDGTSIGIAYSTPNKGGYGRTLTGAAFGSASFGFEAVGGTTTNGGLVGGLSFILSQNDSSRLVGSAIQSNLVGTTATNYGADLRFYAKADAGVLGEVARMTSAGLRVYGTIVKDGGTSSQFLMADGSVSTGVANTITGSLTSGYIPKATGANTLSNSLLYENGTKVFIGTTTTNSISTGGLTLSNATSSSLVLYNGAVIGFIYGSSVAAGMAVSSDYDLRFETGDGSGSNWPERMRLFRSTGNLSLGYGGSPADSGYKLDVKGQSRYYRNDSSNISLIIQNDYINQGDLINFKHNTAGSTTNAYIGHGGDNTGNFVIINNGITPVSFARSTGAATFVNNVDVAGNVTLGNGTLFVSAGSGQSYSGRLSVVYSYPYIDTYLDSYAGASYESRLNFRTNSGGGAMSTKMTIYNSGNVLIGTTTDSGYKLDVSGTGRFTGQLTSDYRLGLPGMTIGYWDSSNNRIESGTRPLFITSYSQPIKFGIDGSENMRLSTSGSLGIGTTNPLMQIHSSKAGGNGIFVSNTTSNTGGYVYASTYTFQLQATDSANSSVGTLSLQPFGGNVLIGTGTDNGARLRVVGGTIDFAGDTRYGVARIYNASVGDMFGMEQVGAGQTGSGAATRLFTAYSNGNFLSLGWYTTATAFTDALKIACTSGAATFMNTVTATSFFESSDFRLKTLIESNPIIDGIEKLEAKLYAKNGKIEFGYFAQDAEKIMPYAISKGMDGFLNLSYREVHTAKIARLEQRVAELEKQLNVA